MAVRAGSLQRGRSAHNGWERPGRNSLALVAPDNGPCLLAFDPGSEYCQACVMLTLIMNMFYHKGPGKNGGRARGVGRRGVEMGPLTLIILHSLVMNK